MAVRTHVILDGLQDPLLARDLSARWAAAGIDNAVDPAGQAAWLAPGDAADETESEDDDRKAARDELSADDVARAAAIARAYGVELRDRAGNTFQAENDIEKLRSQIAREYRSRFAQALVFGLPAIGIHYLGPVLASGGGTSAANMLYPWLFEMVLVGWALWAGGLPILWQGALSLLHLRSTADLFVTAVVLAAFVPSAIGVASLLFVDEPWFGVQPQTIGGGCGGPMFHAAMIVTLIALAQRWLLHRNVERLSRRAPLMMPRFGKLLSAWLLIAIVMMFAVSWPAGLALALVMPPLLSLGAVNRWSPGWSMALPVTAFALLLLIGPGAVELLRPAAHLRIEIAALFAAMMTVAFALSWSRLPPLQVSSLKPQA